MRKFFYKCGEETLWIPEPESYADCVTLARSDMFRLGIKHASVIGMAFGRAEHRLHFWLRMSSYRRGWAYYLCRYLYGRLSTKFNVQIPPRTRIGYGLKLGHNSAVIVSHTAIIGNNCNLSQFTTIGSNHSHAAVIGNDVYMGPSVCLVENVNIGSGSAVGAGSVVVKDVAPGTTVAGVPARAISAHGHPEYIRPGWPVE